MTQPRRGIADGRQEPQHLRAAVDRVLEILRPLPRETQERVLRAAIALVGPFSDDAK